MMSLRGYARWLKDWLCGVPPVRHPAESRPPEDLQRFNVEEGLVTEFPLGRKMGDYEELLRQRQLPVRIPGTCNICGYDAGFPLCSDNFRDDLRCPRCKSMNRKRQIAAVVLDELGLGWQSIVADSRDRFPRTVWIMETGPTAEAFPAAELYTSEYLGTEYESGTVHGGVRHEDAMKPSFADGSLDLVISSDVFEHIPDPYLAHRQILRCLKPGGFHVFTVPFHEHTAVEDVRATVEDGKEVYHKEKIFHLDPLRPEGVLVYRIFTIQMLSLLEEIGFQVRMVRLRSLRFAILGSNGLVFVARKPAG